MRRRSYSQAGNQTVVASAVRNANGDSGALSGWARGGGPQSRLDITAASGTTPSLAVFIEDSVDGVSWTVRDTYPAQTATSTVTRALPVGLEPYQRVRWVVTGTTPSFTFSVQFAASADALL